MRIYNGKNSQLDLPLVGSSERLTIQAHSYSKNFMPNEDFLSLVVTSYDTDEIALIIAGPYEVSMCSRISGCNALVVNSLEEALLRFAPEQIQTSEPEVATVEEKPEPIVLPPAESVFDEAPQEESELPTFPVEETTTEDTQEDTTPEEETSEETETVEEAESPKRLRRRRIKKATSEEE